MYCAEGNQKQELLWAKEDFEHDGRWPGPGAGSAWLTAKAMVTYVGSGATLPGWEFHVYTNSVTVNEAVHYCVPTVSSCPLQNGECSQCLSITPCRVLRKWLWLPLPRGNHSAGANALVSVRFFPSKFFFTYSVSAHSYLWNNWVEWADVRPFVLPPLVYSVASTGPLRYSRGQHNCSRTNIEVSCSTLIHSRLFPSLLHLGARFGI